MIQVSQAPNAVLDQDQLEINITKTLNTLKLNYLIDEKKSSQAQISELYLNNQLLRQINLSLSKNQHIQIRRLIELNQKMEKKIECLNKQVKQLKANIFVSSQVELQNQKFHKQIFQKYEQKIIELRRLIQSKEVSVQFLESQISNPQITHHHLPSQLKIELFDEVQELKLVAKQITKKNQVLAEKNQQLQIQNKILKQKLQKINRLTSNKCLFTQYKNNMDSKKTKSLQKSYLGWKGDEDATCEQTVRLNLQKSKYQKVNETIDPRLLNQSNNRSEYERRIYSMDIFLLNRLLRIKCQQVIKLENKAKILARHHANLQSQNAMLRKSNQIYQKSRRSITERANIYESTCFYLYELFMQRCSAFINSQKVKNDFWVEPMAKQKLIKNKILIQKQKSKNKKMHHLGKQEWLSIKRQLSNGKPNLNAYKRKIRSYSCVIDYLFVQKVQNRFEDTINLDEDSKWNLQIQGSVNNNFGLNRTLKRQQHCTGFLDALDDF